jgi:4-diphosphocytidyl-2-C-methyl-D-erythritol kinase
MESAIIQSINLKSYAKINLTLDVKGIHDNGFHEVEMIMQQILLCDDISVRWHGGGDGFAVNLKTNRRYLPVDERNLAYKAAMLMKEESDRDGEEICGKLDIDIKKRIPVAGGLAGGSGNGAAVLHALNVIWGKDMDVKGLIEIGSKLGSDVPFCIMGQAAENMNLKGRFADDPLACHCALATGTGTELKPLKGLKSHLILSKPAISVSTAGVYKGIDSEEIPERPDTGAMIAALEEENRCEIEKNMVNVLENYTLKRYAVVMYTKNKIQRECNPRSVLMSGSGPTVFGLCNSREEAKRICDIMRKENSESFWTRTTW